MFDLDNTLVHRAAAFRSLVHALVEEHGGNDDDVDALLTADRDGYAPRELVASTARDRFGLADDVGALVERFRHELIDRLTLEASVIEALGRVRAAGYRVVIVTNGGPAQELKIRATGLDGLVDGWCVSAIEGVAKPDAEIFRRAAAKVGSVLSADDWMFGDNPEADIAGGAIVGVRTVWIRRGRDWPLLGCRPDIAVESVTEGVDRMLADLGPLAES